MPKNERFTKEYKLSSQSIDSIALEIEKISKALKIDRNTALRFRLSIEESLMVWMHSLGEGINVTLEFGSLLRKPFIRISVEGRQLNPYENEDEDFGSAKNMLVRVGLIPVYSYHGNKNTLQFNIKKKELNQLAVLAIVIIGAVAVGLIGKMLIPAHIVSSLCDDIITPLEDTMFNILSCIAGPMIFLSVAWGIYGLGDVYTFGRIGKKMMLSFLGVVFTFCVGGALFYPLLGPAISSSIARESQHKALFEMILDIFPSDIFSPFVEGNTLQIIVIAMAVGIALIFLGQRTRAIATAVEQINHIINFIMNFISKLVPYFVFIVLVQLIWSSQLGTFASIWKLALIYVIAFTAFNLLLALYSSLRYKVGFFWLLRSCFPSFIIALTTASSAAAFDSNMDICRNKLGIKDSLASFGVPFGMVIHKPNTALYYILFCMYAANVYDVDVSFIWIVSAVIVITISAVATPPIPGGSTATYTILFLQLGIPADVLAIALSIDMIFDFLMTSGDMVSLLFELFNISVRTDMRKKNSGSKCIEKQQGE